MKEVKLPDFLKLKPPVFTREGGGEDPQSFLDGCKKACMALRCTSENMVELVSYQLQGKANEWWHTQNGGYASDAPSISWKEFKKAFIERFIPISLRISRA